MRPRAEGRTAVHQHQSSGLAYRADLDGLRALAVIAVILFHFEVSWAQGGYVGVDIFFVLSGYLMTSMLWPEHRPGIAEFYERRLRRLVPASYAVAMAVGLVVAMVSSPVQIQAFANQLLASAAFVVNVLFWSENTYFTTDLFRPLLHYWSLAVEVQYYLVFPLLLCAVRRRVGLLVALFVVSTIASVVVTNASPKTAFFMMPTRLGEFLLGTFAYLIEARKPRVSGAAVAGLSSASLAVIGICVAVYSAATPFPHVTALIPGLAVASLIVLGANENTAVSSLYTNRAMTYIGTRSYSIYLWHYPVPFLFREALDRPPSPLEMIGLLVLIGVLSEMTYCWVEQPFRNRAKVSRHKAILSWAGGLAAVTAFAGASLLTAGFIGRFPEAERNVYLSMQDRDVYRCGKLARLLEPRSETCTLHSAGPDTPRVLLWGDSHADAIKPAVRAAAAESGVTLLLNKRNCSVARQDGECRSNLTLLDEMAALNIGKVILHDEAGVFARENWPRIEMALARLTELGIKIVIIAPTPSFKVTVPDAVLAELKTGQENPALTLTAEAYRSSLADYTAFEDAAKTKFPLVKFVDITSVVCASGQCRSHEGGTVFYFDSHHVSVSAAMRLLPSVREALGE